MALPVLSDDALGEIEVLRSIFEDLVETPPPADVPQSSRGIFAIKLLVPVTIPERGVSCIALGPLVTLATLEPAAVLPTPPPAPTLLRRGSSNTSKPGAPAPPRVRLISLTAIPPLEMTVLFSAGYPATSAPTIGLRAAWLTAPLGESILREICPRPWHDRQAGGGETCVFQWHSWLSDEVPRALQLESGTGSAGSRVGPAVLPPPPWLTDVRLAKEGVRLLLTRPGDVDGVSGSGLQLPRLETVAAAALREAAAGGGVSEGAPLVERCLVLDESVGTAVWMLPDGEIITMAKRGAAEGGHQPQQLGGKGSAESPLLPPGLAAVAGAVDALLAHDLASRRAAWLSGTLSCPICLDDRPGPECLALAACGHAFCRACLRTHTLETLRGGFAAPVGGGGGPGGRGGGLGVPCPDLSCGLLLEHHDVRAALVPSGHAEEFARYEALLLQRFLHLDGGAVCPNPACGSACVWSSLLTLSSSLSPLLRLSLLPQCPGPASRGSESDQEGGNGASNSLSPPPASAAPAAAAAATARLSASARAARAASTHSTTRGPHRACSCAPTATAPSACTARGRGTRPSPARRRRAAVRRCGGSRRTSLLSPPIL